jgi:hypothetical protein
MMGRVPVNSLHFVPLPWEIWVKRIYVRSFGLYRLILFGPCASSRIGISWFGCRSSLSLWTVPCFGTSRTVDLSISVCRTLLVMSRGAFTIVRNTLFWKRCSIVILDWEAMPQRGIPYLYPFSVHVTFNFITNSCTYLIKNYRNSHLKPHTLKMSVMHN